MSKSSKKKKKKKTDARPGMQKLKEEVAAELGLLDEIHDKGWGGLSSRETGKIGGVISKKLKKKSNNRQAFEKNKGES